MRRRLAALALSIAIAPAGADVAVDALTYYGYTDTKTVAFTSTCAFCERHEWELVSYQRDHVAVRGSAANSGHIANPCSNGQRNRIILQVRLPRTGHYFLRVRSCAADECSAWSSSMDLSVASVDCQARSWWWYGYPQPPGTPAFQ